MFLLTAALLVTSLGILESSASDSGELSSDIFPFHKRLNEDYNLFWNFNSSHILFKAVVKTNGFVGFGISPDGGMVMSDIVIGWVKDGQAYFLDTFAEGHYMPTIKAKKDWELLSGTEAGEFTTLIFLRKLFPCEAKHLPISKGTTRVIYSYGPQDPSANNSINYHGSHRGAKSVLLLTPPKEQQLPDDVMTLEFTSKNLSVPGEETYYSCSMFKIKPLGQKHHVIRVEPILQPGSEDIVHHVLLYFCRHSFEENLIGVPYRCYTKTPQSMTYCQQHMLAIWAVGGEGYNYPEFAGHSLGAPGDPVYLRLEIHYNNPTLRTDIVDNSGLRLYLTKKLRQFDAGFIEAGSSFNSYLAVPPYEKSFINSGYCTKECIEKNLGDQEIKVFGGLLHTHLIGRKIRTRHIRSGVELAPLLEDNSYDFNYQQMRILDTQTVVQKGDFLLVECDYDSSERTTVTYGGLSTKHEMCFSFLLYYPMTNLTSCASSIKYKFDDHTNVNKFVSNLNQRNWTDPDVRKQFKADVQESEILDYCGLDAESKAEHFPTVSYPKPVIKETYKVPDQCSK